ncbi:acyl-CoA synthase [Plesiocystis pacifica SIR-1]|uniref:Acyl-CoA synthase n=1 Tax=Plesiocystis pacifica SIR-1 TaxID=391625 RepID=A6GGG7_9BACT|nr:SPFH domain-containing protein [Plesiocystis pacifica]EDM75043.1 acyl-CoA synthase [Plesiocystis pacifica SIR-1]
MGVRAEAGALAYATRRGRRPLQWPVGQDDSIIHRLPRDPRERASIFAETQAIIVNPDEVALVIEDGRASGDLQPGSYMFEKTRVTGSLDVIWMKTGQRQLKWGLGNVCTRDGIEVSANGVAHLRLGDPLIFNRELLQGAARLSEVDLQRLLMPRFQAVLRSVIATCPTAELHAQRELFDARVSQALGDTLGDIGLLLLDLEVVEINLPQEFKTAMARGALSRLGGEAEIYEAQTRARVAQLDAQADHAGGFVRAELMAHMHARGIDPAQVSVLDSLRSMAEVPQLPFSGGAARAALVGQLAQTVLSQPPPPPTIEPSPSTSEALPPGPEDPRAIEAQIDKLVERLANGEISEALFERLSQRLERKLAR